MTYFLRIRKLIADKKKEPRPGSKEAWDKEFGTKLDPPIGYKYERGIWNVFTMASPEENLR